jgi:hypothetical protein
MSTLRAGNLALKFALEVAAVAAFAYWGATAASGVMAVVLAIVAPVVAIVLWGRFAAPRSERRLQLRLRVPFELTVFALAALALAPASSGLAVTLVAVVIVNSLLLTVLEQWEA